MGYKFQFVTLAGFHALNYSMFKLAHSYRDRGMAAYSELQEAEFAAEADGYTADETSARSRHRVLRRRRPRHRGRRKLDRGSARLDRRRAISLKLVSPCRRRRARGVPLLRGARARRPPFTATLRKLFHRAQLSRGAHDRTVRGACTAPNWSGAFPPMKANSAALTDSRLAALCAEEARTAFRDYESRFDEITRRARDRFLARDWRGTQADATDRLHLYSQVLDGLTSRVKS